MKPILVIGAGITGLTIAHTLGRCGIPVVVIERSHVVGGLARSFRYDTQVFDVGPHRFFSRDPEVLSFISDVLVDSALRIQRESGVYFHGAYYSWPLTRRAILSLPWSLLAATALDRLNHLIIRRGSDPVNFREYVVRSFGEPLYAAFFDGYTRKFLRLPPDQVHRDWAEASLQKAIIHPAVREKDQMRYSAVLSHGHSAREFIYPRGGMGQFCDLLAGRVRAQGTEIILGDEIARLDAVDRRISGATLRSGRTFAPAQIFWTAPLGSLTGHLGLPDTGLTSLSTVLYNIVTQRTPSSRYQWCYFGDEHIVFNRASLPHRFSPALCPGTSGGICVEVTARPGDDAWNEPDRLFPAITRGLLATGLLERETDIASLHVERIADTYPCYAIDYRARLALSLQRIGVYENITLAGRNGLFWYNNMDECIANGLAVARAFQALHARKDPLCA